MRIMLILFTLLTGQAAFGACEELKKLHGLVNLKERTWETTHVNKKSVKVCGELPVVSSPNLEVTITKGKKKFSTVLYRPLVGYWDETTDGKKLNGGKYDITYLPIETFAPAWFKSAKITVRELPSKKIIVEAKL